MGLYDYRARYYDPALGRFIQPDTIVPEQGDPQALNRYAYVRDNPLRYTDPSGHCWGAYSFVRQIPGYKQTCDNLEMAIAILQSDKASLTQKVMAGAYVFAEVTAHAMLIDGIVLLAGEGSGALLGMAGSGGTATTFAEVGTAAGAGAAAACADGDCTNEVESVTRVFWSGGEVAKNAAQEWALRNGGVTLEMTSEGRYLESVSQDMDWLTEARPLWVQASRNFALQAEGEVHVFQVAERGVSLQSIWATVEYPTLLSNPQVKEIIYHIIMPSGDDIIIK